MSTTLSQNIIALAQAAGADIKNLRNRTGALENLNTTAKTNLVAAINEIKQALNSFSQIDDVNEASGTTWSSNKIASEISGAINALLDGAPEAYDTLKEIADYISSDSGATSALVTAVANRVRFDDAQQLTENQQKQACANIGVGDPTEDFVDAYESERDGA